VGNDNETTKKSDGNSTERIIQTVHLGELLLPRNKPFEAPTCKCFL
jgi:hypothetical protein